MTKTRTRQQIEQDIAKAQAAAQALPEMEQRATAAPDLEAELRQWELSHGWPQRYAEAEEQGKAVAAELANREASLATALKGISESALGQALKALSDISTLHGDLRKAAQAYCHVSYERAMVLQREAGEPASMSSARIAAAQVASPSRVDGLIQQWFPRQSVYDAVQLEQRALLQVLLRLAFPQDYLRENQVADTRSLDK